MEFRELITIELIALKTEFPVQVEHILIAEIVGDMYIKFYFAELPVINTAIRKRLRFYENLVN